MIETTARDSIRRFDERVANYIAYRPHYPRAVADFLRSELALNAASVVADVGSGTGILSELLLAQGATVFGVEPNAAMRAAAEELLQGYPNFKSVAATAEATTLPALSVDLVTAGQAFHWFDADGARREFKRILKPGGAVVLVWNMRRLDSTPFLRDYEALLRKFGTDYAQVNCEQLPEEKIASFFAGAYKQRSFANEQVCAYEGVRGRLLSSSYVPLAGQPEHEPMLAELRRIFDLHQRAGRVTIEYDTKLYYGRLA
ncbi:MAG TPA: class I SAM-dependent methyltransferase [Pyrinomonadaceae bacterium]|jgi:SAM-dependent methyltransferase